MDAPYYRPDLARVHHEGFAFHADDAAAVSTTSTPRWSGSSPFTRGVEPE